MLTLIWVLVGCVALTGVLGDTKCTNKNGICQIDSNACPGGSYESGLCSGASNRRCCLGSDLPCTNQNGICQIDTNACPGGSYESGLCSGASNRRCCLGSDLPCTNQNGICQIDSNACTGGSYESGLCSGASNRRCCIGSVSGCSAVTIKSRADWGARDPTSSSSVQNPLGMFFVHHTAGGECDSFSTCSSKVRGIQNYHMDTNGWSDIGYSFLVGGDGNVYEGRGWDKVGAHTYGYNSQGYAASFIGDFTSKLPTSAAIQAAKDLIACGVELGKLSSTYKLYGHRQAGSTTCPGNTLYADIQNWPN